MLSRAEKDKLFADYQQIFNGACVGVLLEMKGMKVEDMTVLRQKLLKDGSKLKVLKNRVAVKATVGTPFEQIADNLTQVRALVYNDSDVVAPAKLLAKELKDNENLKITGGIMVSGSRSDLLTASQVVALGNLPSKEELIAKLLFVLNAPVTNFVRTLNEVPASFVRTLQAVADKKAA